MQRNGAPGIRLFQIHKLGSFVALIFSRRSRCRTLGVKYRLPSVYFKMLNLTITLGVAEILNLRRSKVVNWDQKRFFPVSFFRKLIVHKFLCLKLFCSSKIVDFRAYFVKISVAQAFFTFGLPHFYNLIPLLAPLELYKWKCPSVGIILLFLDDQYS